MAQWGPLQKTGEGHAALTTVAVAVGDIIARAIALPSNNTRYVGTMAPRGLWHVGAYGLGYFPGDPWNFANPTIVWERFMRHETEDFSVQGNQNGKLFAPSFWWRLLPGVTIEFTVFW